MRYTAAAAATNDAKVFCLNLFPIGKKMNDRETTIGR